MSDTTTLELLDNLGRRAQTFETFEVWDQFFEGAERIIYEQRERNESISESVILKVEQLCDELLAQYPLIIGYWKRYATMKYQMRGIEASLKLVRGALHIFATSSELWCDYLSIIINNQLEDSITIQNLFEQAIDTCGRQFLSHPLWDSYLRWLISFYGESEVYFKSLLEVVQIPLYEYSKYHKALIDSLQHENLKGKVKVLLGVSSEEELYQAVDHICNRTQEATNQRWPYESLIKQPFFTFDKPSDDELTNWNNYLDFEETHGDNNQVICLYERCLIPCSRLESFWIRYTKWFQRSNEDGIDQLMTIFRRGSDLFLPPDKLKFRFMFAEYLCNISDANVDTAMNIFHSMAKKLPGNSEVVRNYLQVILQHKEGHNVISKLQMVLEQGFRSIDNKRAIRNSIENQDLLKLLEILNKKTITAVLTVLIKHFWMLGERERVELQRNIFLRYYQHEYLSSSIPFWILFFKFECLEKSNTNLINVVNYVNSTLRVPMVQKSIILGAYRDCTLNNLLTEGIFLNINQRPIPVAMTNLLNTEILVLESKAGVPHEPKDFAESDKRLFQENGHSGIAIEKQPSITNVSNLRKSIFEESSPASLPTFKNVEKAAQPVRFEI
ncbi:BA75_02338T0 [Komagataella pastoris]|uniref:BA75_02338T0 n=1 Tax=Komagataella pastoris TaxID=4922 RepID=A0A1B2JAW4_PICPA|nr:BA75_02338T0 [Komagataella pastoris]